MQDKENNPESNGKPIYVYKGKLKQNINSVGEKVKGEKKFRVAVIVAGSALVVLLTVMVICLVGVSSSMRARKVVTQTEITAVPQADSLAVTDTTKQ